MITNLSQFKSVPAILGIILIDCWKSDKLFAKDYTDKFYSNLIKNIEKRPNVFNFKSQINAAGDTFWDYSDISVVNTLKKYCWDSNEESMQQQIDHLHLVNNLLKGLRPSIVEKTQREIDPQIKTAFLNNGNAFSIINSKDFIYHWTHTLKQQINDWLIVGQSWGMCVHESGLGVQVCAELSKDYPIRFYATDYSFLKINGDTVEFNDFMADHYGWEVIPNFGYQLQPAKPK